MLRRLFYAIAKRLRPELALMSGPGLIGSLMDIAAVIYLLPFAVVGGIWLIAITDIDLIAQNWALFLAASALAWVFVRLEFTLQLEVRPGVFALASGSFENLIFWSTTLMVGPTFLWIAVITAVLSFLWPTGPFHNRRWYRLRVLVSEFVGSILASLIAVRLYEYLGGPVPLRGNILSLIWPAVAATLASIFLGRLMMLPLLLYASRSPELVGSGSLTDQASLTRFLVVGSLVSRIADPFAVLGAMLYSDLGSGVYFAFVAGALLAVFLANRISQSAARSEQRTREMRLIEALGRAIMTEPATTSALPSLLAERIVGLFPGCHLEVRLFPDEILYRHLAEGFSVDQAVWERLQQSGTRQFELPRMTQTGSDSGGPWKALAVSIMKPDDEEAAGGIFLMWQPTRVQNRDLFPAVLSLADQITAALRRIELLQDALDEQAGAYQKEVYAQAYQAQVYAQALALEKMTQELEVAGKIQASFLPTELPEVSGWQMAVALEPAREASGDFYDLIELPNGCLGFVIADVADKGMGAALYMALSRTLIRTYALEHDRFPERALAAANRRILADTTADLFVTVFYGILDTVSGSFTYCNAGHNPPYLIQSQNGDMPLPLQRTALPLGIMDGGEWRSSEVRLEAGDVLAMYTDGVTEAQDEDESFFGEERLLNVLRANARRSAEVIEEKIITAVFDFVGDAPQFDDITMMVVARK